jgi:hypothetical protein
MIRDLLRLRNRNQLTLPSRVTEKLSLEPGALLELTLTDAGHVELRPARIATVGSPEADREERQAMKDIEHGRYAEFKSVEQFENDLRERAAGKERGRLAEDISTLRTRMKELTQELERVTSAIQQDAPPARFRERSLRGRRMKQGGRTL